MFYLICLISCDETENAKNRPFDLFVSNNEIIISCSQVLEMILKAGSFFICFMRKCVCKGYILNSIALYYVLNRMKDKNLVLRWRCRTFIFVDRLRVFGLSLMVWVCLV